MALDTEEEQVEKIQNIWNSYKYLIISGFVVFFGVYFAYGFYTDQKIKKTEEASELYQEILVKKRVDIDGIKEKIDLLKQNYSNTPYAARSAVYLSKLYSQDSKNEEAIKELIWASENAAEESIQSMAYYNLANLYFVTNKLDEAMSSAKKINTIGFQTLAKDIIGDIYLKQGNKEEASKSYLDSLQSYKGRGDMRKILQNKIDSIGK
ncbi:tetratricopeptide repeat protein [Methylophilaceae bacterium]|jgi:predicted negative regulator of RcsB-dependent stress response|nr:tetratricopeptide repeat protein [Methylophilaceae bacterium]